MIVVMKQGANPKEVERLTHQLEAQGVVVSPVVGSDITILGLVGDTTHVDPARIEASPAVERVMHVAEPFKKASRMFHPQDSHIAVGDHMIGQGTLTVMAGPCAVEGRQQIISLAAQVKQAGGHILRGGAYKPRTSPYAFQGMGLQGLQYMEEAGNQAGLPIVTEVVTPRDVEKMLPHCHMLQVGARNMQNFDLLKELSRTRKPVLLKRGPSATIEEWLLAAEYLLAGGNDQVVLCERGIKTFGSYTRNTLDISAVPAVKKLSHLPIIVDPSHATGKWWMVESMALAAIAAGADGVMVEVHQDPTHAMSDGRQSITPDGFETMMDKVKVLAQAMGRSL